MAKSSRLLRNFIVTVVLGGFGVGICLAAMVPGAAIVVRANHYTGNLKGKLSKLSEPTKIYAADGTQIGTLASQDRENVKLSEVPKVMIDAVVATEDRTFFSNPGLDGSALFRAAMDNFTSGKIEQGGSTITQQLVKNRILTPKRNLNRKLKEIVLSARLDNELSKKQILEEYLNTIYFGQGSYGIKAATRRFFLKVDPGAPFPRGQNLDELNLPQAALLAGVISNPEGDNPWQFPEHALARRAVVLKRMREQGYISPALEKFANLAPLGVTFKPPAEYKPDNAWAAEVYERLKSDKRLGTTAQERQNQLLRGGLKIYSTLDPGLQADAQRAVDTAQKRKGFELSVVGLDPKTGQVKAMANSFPFAVTQYNLATHIPGMQPGSTYKTITLAAALEAGFSPNDTVDGTSPCKLPHHPESLSNAEPGGGTMPVRSATEESVNCAFLRIATALGPEKIVAMANRMGIHIPRPNNPDQFVAVPTITLGAIEATPLEMAGVGGILANDGVRHAPIFVTKVLDSEGNVVFEQNESPAEQVIDPDIASCETDVLRGVITHGTGSGLSFSHVAAGKTGTTDNKVRAWFVGYTPQLASAVAYGNPDDNRTPGAGFGAQVPGHTWRTFMQSALADQPEIAFPAAGPVCSRPGHFIDPTGRKPYSQAPTPRPPTFVPPPGTIPPNPTPTTAAKPVPPTTAKPVPPAAPPTTPAPPP